MMIDNKKIEHTKTKKNIIFQWVEIDEIATHCFRSVCNDKKMLRDDVKGRTFNII
jgi:hypothetical protein